MTNPSVISEAEVRAVTCGPIRWPDATTSPLTSALTAKLIYRMLIEAYGPQRVFLADTLGCIGDHATTEGSRVGMMCLSRWNAAQLAAGEPQGIRALTAAAKTEAQTHATKTTA